MFIVKKNFFKGHWTNGGPDKVQKFSFIRFWILFHLSKNHYIVQTSDKIS